MDKWTNFSWKNLQVISHYITRGHLTCKGRGHQPISGKGTLRWNKEEISGCSLLLNGFLWCGQLAEDHPALVVREGVGRTTTQGLEQALP